MGEAQSHGLVAFEANAFRGRSVLVADDDAGVRDLLTKLFRDAGAVVHEADSGESLFALLREVGAGRLDVDVLVCDDQMPGSSARTALRAAAALPKPPPVVIVTGGQADPTLLQTLGANMTVRKPFRLAELHRAVWNATRKPAS
jgi:two-component system CAI-1 autoinducer sensor kinase/phosphatase CqsS